MKNKIIAICISVLVCIAFIVPASIFGEGNAADGNSQPAVENNEQIEDNTTSEQTSEPVNTNGDNEVVPGTGSSENEDVHGEDAEENAMEPQMARSPQNSPGEKTPWAKLKENIEEGSSETITLDEDVIADLDKDAGQTINIASGKNVVLKGGFKIKGIGFSSFKVEKGGSLTIDGPSISNAQIITEGNLILNSGKISDTKLEGPTIFVNSGTFTMNGGEVSGNEAQNSQTPQPNGVMALKYSPISIYNSGKLILNGGSISNNQGFLRGGAIGSWVTDSSRGNITINGGEITGNKAVNSRLTVWGGGIYMENCDFEMHGGVVSKNTADYGGGIAAAKSKAKILSGTISENTNGNYPGKGGGILIADTDTIIKNVNISNNIANGPGGGVFIVGSNDAQYRLLIDGAIVQGNSSINSKFPLGGGIFISNYKYTIDGGQFIANSSDESGGALAAYGTSSGTINAGLFENNNSNGFWGGGAIYNDTKCELTINRALIKEKSFKENFMIGIGVGGKNKPISRQGGGIWNCPTGHTIINITNGLAMYDNLAPNFVGGVNNGAGDDFANITKYENGEPEGSSSVKLASRMLGGGYRLWYQDGSFQGIHSNWPKEEQTPRYNPESPGEPLPYNTIINEKKGAQLAYKSVPAQESKKLADQVATTIFRNNIAQGTGISGGAITNNGKLIFGEDTPYKIKIVKSWTGDDINKRPKKITLKMYVGTHYIEDIVLTKEENWTYIIDKFPDPDTLVDNKTVDNKTKKVLPINFREVNSGKYVLSITKTTRDEKERTYTIDLENTIPKPPEKITVEGSKTWNDAENQDGIRPEEITINLLKNGKKIASKKVTEADGWKWKFENLEKYENGKLIEYTISEEKVEGYKTEIKGNVKDGFVVTNTKEPEKIKVEGLKTWNDKNNKVGIRPKSITINLLKNGEKIASKQVTAKDNWRYKFENLDKFENGKEIKYTISEDKVDKYTTKIDGFNITNTYIPPEKPSTPNTSDPSSMNILCIALLAASYAAIYTLRKKKKM